MQVINSKIEEIINSSIYWQKHSHNEKYFYAYNNKELLLLRLNDFPDEPLITLIKDLEIIDLEEVPKNWVVPF